MDKLKLIAAWRRKIDAEGKERGLHHLIDSIGALCGTKTPANGWGPEESAGTAHRCMKCTRREWAIADAKIGKVRTK